MIFFSFLCWMNIIFYCHFICLSHILMFPKFNLSIIRLSSISSTQFKLHSNCISIAICVTFPWQLTRHSCLQWICWLYCFHCRFHIPTVSLDLQMYWVTQKCSDWWYISGRSFPRYKQNIIAFCFQRELLKSLPTETECNGYFHLPK